MSTTALVTSKTIENRIFNIRGVQVMFDRDLAVLYQVETRVLNQAVKRNMDRFPQKFCFQLTEQEFKDWRSQTVMSNEDKIGLRRPPYVFTEQGVAMLSAVLKSTIAVKVSIQIMDAFVEIRKTVASTAPLFKRIENIERKQLEADKNFEQLFSALERDIVPTQGIFYDGQVFDAYTFVAGVIRKAKSNIILIDNYVDDTVLQLFTKRKKDVTVTICTKPISRILQLDLEKFNAQYPPIAIKLLPVVHDRFLIIDEKELYHIGASLKDLGKKWFGFSRMDSQTDSILNKLKEVDNG